MSFPGPLTTQHVFRCEPKNERRRVLFLSSTETKRGRGSELAVGYSTFQRAEARRVTRSNTATAIELTTHMG